MILTMGTYNVQGTLSDGQYVVQNVVAGTEINSPAFTQLAMESLYGAFGNIFIAIAVFFFAFTTILANYYIAEVNVVYLTRFISPKANKVGLFFVKVLMMVMIAYGALNSAGYIWAIGDIGVGLIAWLNIVGILVIFFMARPAIKALRDYEAQRKAGVTTYTFDPIKIGVKNASYWEERHLKKSKP
jgi:AGCS family alanine or glycine:cation symporter